MATKLITFTALMLSMMIATNASAQEDLSWLKTANDCETFSAGVVKFQHSLALKGSLTEDDRSSLKLILKEACTDRFSSCGFTFCQTGEPNEAPAAQETAPATRRAQLRPAIVTDPLAWLEQPLQCEDLVDQIKARYAPLGSYANLPPVKKDELSKVLDVACSDRFQHCRFPSCGQEKASSKNARGSTAVETKPVRARLSTSSAAIDAMVDDSAIHAAALKAEAEAEASAKRAVFEQLYAEKTRERRLQIERAVAEEKAKGVAWKIFSIPGEIESRLSGKSDDDGEAPEKGSVNSATERPVNYAAVDNAVSKEVTSRQTAVKGRFDAASANARSLAPKSTMYRAGHSGIEKQVPPSAPVAPQRMF